MLGTQLFQIFRRIEFIRIMFPANAMFSKFMSIAFPAIPLLLMVILPSFRKQSTSTYWGIPGSIALTLFVIIYFIFQKSQPIPNGPISLFIVYLLGPTVFVFLFSRLPHLWTYRTVGIIFVPLTYFSGWIASINIGLVLGILHP